MFINNFAAIIIFIQINVFVNMLFNILLSRILNVPRSKFPPLINILSMIFGHIMCLFFIKLIRKYVKNYNEYNRYMELKIHHEISNTKYSEEFKRLDRKFKLKTILK